MKVLIMCFMFVLVGCGGSDSAVVFDPVVAHCSDNTKYRKIVELSTTTYAILKNTCNEIQEIVLNVDDDIQSITRSFAPGNSTEPQLIKTTYSGNSLTFTENTSITANGYKVSFNYHYTKGDNFITRTSLPRNIISYIYEGESGFDKILNSTLLDIIALEVNEAIPSIK